jgi:8-oxo-dGTP pyrophosphatase MutT (NUDIX family)
MNTNNPMHRNQLLNLLEKHNAFDETETTFLTEIKAFVQQNPDCFERSLLVGHVTGSAWIVDLSHTYTLLTHHRKLDKWFQLGGHCDGDSDVLAVALKEAQEESGLSDFQIVSLNIFDIDIHEIPERKGIPTHLHYDVRFLLEADMAKPLAISSESNDLVWVKLSEVSTLNNSESILRMVRKTIS